MIPDFSYAHIHHPNIHFYKATPKLYRQPPEKTLPRLELGILKPFPHARLHHDFDRELF